MYSLTLYFLFFYFLFFILNFNSTNQTWLGSQWYVGTPGKVRAASSGHTLEAQQINKEEKNNKNCNYKMCFVKYKFNSIKL